MFSHQLFCNLFGFGSYPDVHHSSLGRSSYSFIKFLNRDFLFEFEVNLKPINISLHTNYSSQMSSSSLNMLFISSEISNKSEGVVKGLKKSNASAVLVSPK